MKTMESLLEKYSTFNRKYLRYLLWLYAFFCFITVLIMVDSNSNKLLFMSYEQVPNLLKDLSSLLQNLLVAALGCLIAILIAIIGLDMNITEQVRKIMYYEEYKGRPEHHPVALLIVFFITAFISCIVCGIFSAMSYDIFDLSTKIFAGTCLASCIFAFIVCGVVFLVLFKYLNTIINAVLVFKFLK